MKNPFIKAAARMACMVAAMKENAYRDFYGKDFVGHVGSGRRPFRIQHNPAGSKLARKAAEHRLGTFRGAIVTNLR